MDKKINDKIEIVPIKTIKPYLQNPKKHDNKQIALIAASIRNYGFIMPIVIDGAGEIIAGHGRYLAAVRMNFSEVPVVRVSHLTPDEVKAFRVADNKVAESEWDTDMLRAELTDLKADDFNLDATGFTEKEIATIFEEIKELERADRPEVEFSQELMMEHNYVVLYFDSPLDWQVAQEKFGLKKVKDLIPRKGQPIGIGRVLRGNEWLERIK